jgi:hypothetical protein
MLRIGREFDVRYRDTPHLFSRAAVEPLRSSLDAYMGVVRVMLAEVRKTAFNSWLY